MITEEMITAKGQKRVCGRNLKEIKKWVYPLLLLVLAALLIILSYRPDSLYGSTTDWFAQHVSIAETMRQTILEEGTLFPGRLPLGGGSNIYDFAYYGYLRPDVLLSLLFPGVAMETVITVYSVAGYLWSVVLFYFLLKKAGMKPEAALLGGILFLGAGCFFHIHRHVMFINYMPFLLGALLGVLRYHRTGKSAWTVLMMALIPLHSYYYAISCLVVIYLFFLYTADWEQGRGWRQWWRLTVKYALQALVSVAMAGVLLLPTAASVINCASHKDGGRAGTSPWLMTWNLESLLYSGYGLGLTLIAFLLLVLSLCRKKSRLLAAGILLSLVCGVVPLALNGFLYNRPKILMPFLPLVLFLCVETLGEFWRARRRAPVWVLLPTVWVAYLQYKAHGIFWVWVDLMLVLVLFSVLHWRWRQVWRAEKPKEGLQAGALAVALTLMCGMVFFFAAVLHQEEDYILRENAEISRFSEQERADFYKEKSYRFDTFRSPYNTANRLLAYGAGRSTMYTSTTNPGYSDFFYDEIRTPMGNNNRVGLYSRANPFLLYLMGVRYLEATEHTLPVGYEIRSRSGREVLAEREDVLPLCYGSVDLLSRQAYEKLDFPENLEALTSVSVVEESRGAGDKGPKDSFSSHFKELKPKEGVDYEVKLISQQEFTVIPKEPVKNQILAVSLGVHPKSRKAVTITVNGITNKLSGASAPYPNHNEVFTWFFSSPEPITEFKVKVSGACETDELHIYSLDAAYLGGRSIVPFREEASKMGQAEILGGTIVMPTEGYLITSCPMQPGYRAYVDGKPAAVETVNQAFVGLPLTAGSHEVQLCYEPPLQKAGMAVSAAGGLLWAGGILKDIWKRKRQRKKESEEKMSVKSKVRQVPAGRREGRMRVQSLGTACAGCRELLAYGVGGALTTLVNYIIYFGLQAVKTDYLLANALAWAGAVIFSYIINRSWVFNSKGSCTKEFLTFTGLRLVTLGAESLLLYLAVEQMGLLPSVSKIAVSIVTVVSNYVICQKHIFRKIKEKPVGLPMNQKGQQEGEHTWIN